MLIWFGHVERTKEDLLNRFISGVGMDESEGKGLARRTSVLKKIRSRVPTRNRRASMKRLTSVDAAKQTCQDRSKWKEVVSAYPCEYVY